MKKIDKIDMDMNKPPEVKRRGLDIYVHPMGCKLYGVRVPDLREAANAMPVDGRHIIGILYANNKDNSPYKGRVERGFTGVQYTYNTFPCSFNIYYVLNPLFPMDIVVVKFCATGVMHITGATTLAQGNTIAEHIGNRIASTEIPGIVKEAGVDIKASPCETQMVNGGMRIGFPIHVKNLCEKLREKGLQVTQPLQSPSVKIGFWFNRLPKGAQPGVCKCKTHCSTGKGCGMGDGQCNKTTISILPTGSMQFMGSSSTQQLNTVAAVITEMMDANRASIISGKDLKQSILESIKSIKSIKAQPVSTILT